MGSSEIITKYNYKDIVKQITKAIDGIITQKDILTTHDKNDLLNEITSELERLLKDFEIAKYKF